MSKTLHDNVYDAALNYIADNGNKIYLCSAQPTTFTEASSTYALADDNLTVGDGNGDYTIANGDSGGRKLTVTQQTGVTVDASGTGTYIAICKSSTSLLLAVTSCTSQAVTAGNTVTLNSFKITLGDPT